MLDISQMTEEQLKKIKESARKALEDYKKPELEGSPTNCHNGYNILRYAKAGLLIVKEELI